MWLSTQNNVGIIVNNKLKNNNYQKLTFQVSICFIQHQTRTLLKKVIIEPLGHCKGGNFNIQSWAWFGYYLLRKGNQVLELMIHLSRTNVRVIHENRNRIAIQINLFSIKHLQQCL